MKQLQLAETGNGALVKGLHTTTQSIKDELSRRNMKHKAMHVSRMPYVQRWRQADSKTEADACTTANWARRRDGLDQEGCVAHCAERPVQIFLPLHAKVG